MDQTKGWQALARAVDVAIAREELPPKARQWGKVVLLEVMAGLLGMPASKLKNLYYRQDPRFEQILLDYAMANADATIDLLRALQFRRFSPIVWKRPPEQLAASREGLQGTMSLLSLAERHMRARVDPPAELRREVGTVAAEVMACALTFFDGSDRLKLLGEADAMFRNAMGPLALDNQIAAEDAPLFARFWENRATRCGLEWSNIWDDPRTGPTVGMDVVSLAVEELEKATRWMARMGGSGARDDDSRISQFAADMAKWHAKAGLFDEARAQVATLGDEPNAENDRLLVKALEQITTNALDDALRTASLLADRHAESGESIAPVTSAMMVHNIELMRGKRRPLPDSITRFLRESPVAASEHINLPRYRRRLREAGYLEAVA